MSRDVAPLTIDVRVSPRSSREEIGRTADGRVRIRVNAAPVDNAANRRVVEMVADAFGVAKSAVEVVGGASSRDKRLRIRGATRHPPWFDPGRGAC